MRLILKTKKSLITIYWIKGNSNSVKGWWAGAMFRKELNISDDKHFDCHFTYPEDGNYHLSYKSINNGHEEFISVYWDKVRIKKITPDGKTDEWMSREEFANTSKHLLGHLMAGYQGKSLSEVEHFSFPAFSFNVFDGGFNWEKNEKTIAETDIEKDDFVVNVSDLDKFSVSISAYLRKKETSLHKLSEPLSHWTEYMKICQVSETLVAEFMCRIGFNDKI